MNLLYLYTQWHANKNDRKMNALPVNWECLFVSRLHWQSNSICKTSAAMLSRAALILIAKRRL